MPASHISREFGIRGPVYNCLTACAASTQAIGEATSMLRQISTIERCHPIPPDQNAFRLAAKANNTNSHNITPR